MSNWKIRLIFAWYDCWMGVYWSRKDRTLYVFPIPMIGISFHRVTDEERLMIEAMRAGVQEIYKSMGAI